MKHTSLIFKNREKLLTLDEAAALPVLSMGKTRAQKKHKNTLIRWRVHGLVSDGGDRVKLETVRVGERVMTSEEAVYRFLEKLTQGTETAVVSDARQQQIEQAERENAAAGIQ